MNASYRPSDELSRLLQRTLDGVMPPEDHQRLEELLRIDADAREFFVEFLHLHALLQDQAVAMCLGSEPDGEPDGEPDFVASQADAESSSAKLPAHRTQVSASMSATWRLALFVPWALAATLLLALFLPSTDQPKSPSAASPLQPAPRKNDQVVTDTDQRISRPPAPVATLAAHSNATWRGAQLEIGQPLHEGEAILLEKGKVRISVGYGAEIVASGPCSLTFVANDRVQLNEGAIIVEVAEWAHGFTVVTDKMDVVDLGTTFSVTAKSGQMCETTVLKGMVRALPATSRNGEQRSVLLTEGEGLFVDDSGNRKSFKHIPRETPQEFAADGLRPYRPVELHNTGIMLAEGDQDSHWRVVAGPQDAFTGPDYAQVCVPYKRYLDNVPSESQWVSIRDWETAEPNSIYTFATSFRLEGYDLSTMRLFGRFLADNGVMAVRVNGKSVHVESWTDNVYGQRFDRPQFRFVKMTDGLVEGLNTIEIDVFNGTTAHPVTEEPQSEQNHMALRVEWYAFGRQSLVTSSQLLNQSDKSHPAQLFAKPAAGRVTDRDSHRNFFGEGGVLHLSLH